MTKTDAVINEIKWLSTVTPAGEALWVKVLEPDYKFDKTDGKYEASLVLDPDSEDVVAFQEKLNSYLTSNLKAIKETISERKLGDLKVVPFLSKHYNKDDVPTGKVVLKTKTKATYKGDVIKIPIYNDKGEMVDDWKKLIGNGSTIKLFISAKPYYTSNNNSIGLTLKLKKLQVIKLNEYMDNDSVFKDESIYEVDTSFGNQQEEDF